MLVETLGHYSDSTLGITLQDVGRHLSQCELGSSAMELTLLLR